MFLLLMHNHLINIKVLFFCSRLYFSLILFCINLYFFNNYLPSFAISPISSAFVILFSSTTAPFSNLPFCSEWLVSSEFLFFEVDTSEIVESSWEHTVDSSTGILDGKSSVNIVEIVLIKK